MAGRSTIPPVEAVRGRDDTASHRLFPVDTTTLS